MTPRTLRRRDANLLIAALLAGAGAPLRAQTASPRRYATLSLVGDQFTAVGRREATGSRLDRNDAVEVKIGGQVLDRAVLGVVNELIVKADPAAKPLSLLVDEPVLYARQDELFDGRHLRLPTALIKVARDGGATHVLLISKRRQRFAFSMLDGNPGQGSGAGLGFYIEDEMDVRNVTTGETTTGFLGLFAHLRATVVDLASELIVADRPITRTDLYLNLGPGKQGTTPWNALSARDKLVAISELLLRALRDDVPAVLSAT